MEFAQEIYDDPAAFIAYAERWNNYPSERVVNARYKSGFERGVQLGRSNADSLRITPYDMVKIARSYRWSPAYVEGVYAGIRSTLAVAA